MPDIHDPRCRDGWVDLYDGTMPIACPTCRPDLVQCQSCGATWTQCETKALIRQADRCCRVCQHTGIWPDRTPAQRREPAKPIIDTTCRICTASEAACESRQIWSGYSCCSAHDHG